MNHQPMFSKRQLLTSKTLPYSKDLVQAILQENKMYSKEEAVQSIETYLNTELFRKEKD